MGTLDSISSLVALNAITFNSATRANAMSRVRQMSCEYESESMPDSVNATPRPVLLVTSASGRIGREIVALLKSSGRFTVRAGEYDAAKYDDFLKNIGADEVVKFDLTDKKTWGAACRRSTAPPRTLSSTTTSLSPSTSPHWAVR